MKMEATKSLLLTTVLALTLCSCSYNPFTSNNHLTGSPTGAIAGTAIGAGAAGLLGGSKTMMLLAGAGGGVIGYYATTLRYDSGGILQSGGQVYTIGRLVGIDIPSDRLFEINTADFLPQATPILQSVAAVLARYPNNNIVISGNTSGFYRAKWEQKISEQRAQRVSDFLWNAGITDWTENGSERRQLQYVGHGDYFPLSHTYTNRGIRRNSHIQIVAYPSDCDLKLDRHSAAFHNVGGDDDSDVTSSTTRSCGAKGEC